MRKVKFVGVKDKEDILFVPIPTAQGHQSASVAMFLDGSVNGIWSGHVFIVWVCSMNCRTCIISGKCPFLKVSGLTRNTFAHFQMLQEHTTTLGWEPLGLLHSWIMGLEYKLIPNQQKSWIQDCERHVCLGLHANGWDVGWEPLLRTAVSALSWGPPHRSLQLTDGPASLGHQHSIRVGLELTVGSLGSNTLSVFLFSIVLLGSSIWSSLWLWNMGG